MRYLHAIVLFVALVLPASLAGAAPRPRLPEDVNPVGTEYDEELAIALAASLRLPAGSQSVRQPVMPIIGGAFSGAGGGGLPSVCLSSACATAQPDWTVDQLTEEGQMALAIAESAGVPFVLRPEYLQLSFRKSFLFKTDDSITHLAEGYDVVVSPEQAASGVCSGLGMGRFHLFSSNAQYASGPEARRVNGMRSGNTMNYVFRAVEQRRPDLIVSLVVDCNIKLTMQNEEAETALLVACKNNYIDEAKALLYAYFQILSRQTSENFNELLLEFLEIPDATGKTPLMHAVVHGSYDLVCLLLEAIKRLPAKIPSPFKLYNCFQILNGFDDDGYSPLGYAEKYLESAKEKFGPIIDILKDSGAEDIRPESE